MGREEHLVSSDFALTGNTKDGRFTPSRAQIWTCAFVITGLLERSVVTYLSWDH